MSVARRYSDHFMYKCSRTFCY